MHANIEQLLKIRDGEPVDSQLKQHVEGCEQCVDALKQLQLTRDRLCALPALAAPADGWERLAEKLDEPRARRIRPLWALAASLLVIFAAWIVVGDQQQQPVVTPVPIAAQAPEPRLDDLISQSRRLEALLRDLEQPQVMDADTAGTIAGIQDGIAVIDYGLSRQPKLSQQQSQQLWRQRVGLMGSLVQVRGAQLQQINLEEMQ